MPSLTLTDPDMILPYDGSERESSTPSPPSQLVYLSNLNARYNSSDPHAGSSVGSSGNRAKKNFSRNAWTHEDVTPNPRRLSDIGEELSPARLGGFDEEETGQDQGLADMVATDAKDNAWSSSSSTVSAGSARPREVNSPATVREVSPVQNENAIGMSSAENEEVKKVLAPDSGANLSGSPIAIATAAATGKGPGEDYATAILSSEAERILENAKKRLTVCGGSAHKSPRNADSFLAHGRQFESRSFYYAPHAVAVALGTWVYSASGRA